MDYISIDEAAKKWGLSKRFVQVFCANGRIEGATRLGRAWMIPHNAKKPIDGRTKAARSKRDADMPLPRKTPFLYMTDLYNTPGTADEVGKSLAFNHEARVLFEAEVAKLAAFGMGNQEIAEHLHISLSVVKQAVRIVSEKSGLPRSEFAAIL